MGWGMKERRIMHRKVTFALFLKEGESLIKKEGYLFLSSTQPIPLTANEVSTGVVHAIMRTKITSIPNKAPLGG